MRLTLTSDVSRSAFAIATSLTVVGMGCAASPPATSAVSAPRARSAEAPANTPKHALARAMLIEIALLDSADFSACWRAETPKIRTIDVELTALPEGRFDDIRTVESGPTAECVKRVLADIAYHKFEGEPIRIRDGIHLRFSHVLQPHEVRILTDDHVPLHFRYKTPPLYVREEKPPW